MSGYHAGFDRKSPSYLDLKDFRQLFIIFSGVSVCKQILSIPFGVQTQPAQVGVGCHVGKVLLKAIKGKKQNPGSMSRNVNKQRTWVFVSSFVVVRSTFGGLFELPSILLIYGTIRKKDITRISAGFYYYQ